MSFSLEAGRLRIDKDGVTRFDSEDKLLHGASSGFNISGSRSMPALVAGNGQPLVETNVFNLGAVTSGHTQLIGAVKFSLNSSGFGMFPDRWHCVMGGSIIWVWDGEPGFAAALGDNGPPSQWVDYYFRISGGQAQMVQRVVLTGVPNVYTVLAHTIEYKLRSGNWT